MSEVNANYYRIQRYWTLVGLKVTAA